MPGLAPGIVAFYVHYQRRGWRGQARPDDEADFGRLRKSVAKVRKSVAKVRKSVAKVRKRVARLRKRMARR